MANRKQSSRQKTMAGAIVLTLVATLFVVSFVSRKPVVPVVFSLVGFSTDGQTANFNATNYTRNEIWVTPIVLEVKTTTGWSSVRNTGSPFEVNDSWDVPLPPKVGYEPSITIDHLPSGRYRAKLSYSAAKSFATGWRIHRESLQDLVFGQPSTNVFQVYSEEFSR